MRQRAGQVVSIQSRGSAGACGREARRKASRRAASCSGPTASGAAETNNGVPLRASRSSHCAFFAQGTSRVRPTQSASQDWNTSCCSMRKARVLTPIRRVRSQKRPLVSSPVRLSSNTPAERCGIVLQPMSSVSSRTPARMAAYRSWMTMAVVLLPSAKDQPSSVTCAPIWNPQRPSRSNVEKSCLMSS